LNLVTTPAPSQDSVTADRHTQKTTCAESPLFARYALNPILSGADWPYPINSVFNAGVTRLADGDTLLLCRVEDRRGLSHLCAARSANGIDGWRIDSEPTLAANPREFPEEIWGIEDPRITYVPELEQYAVAYTSFSRGGPGVSLGVVYSPSTQTNREYLRDYQANAGTGFGQSLLVQTSPGQRAEAGAQAAFAFDPGHAWIIAAAP